MEITHTVKLLEETEISPPSGSVSPTSISLTYFDLLHLADRPPSERLFFYDFPHTNAYFLETILPNIKNSLSLTLQRFIPLAGNLTWPEGSVKPEIAYNDGDTVRLTVAESDYDFHQLTANQPRCSTLFSPLIPELDSIADLLGLQITLFPNKGICIGISISHVGSDGNTGVSFMKSWAAISRSEAIDTDPYFDRSALKFLEEKELQYLDIIKKQSNVSRETFLSLKNVHLRSTDKVRATFVLSLSDIKRLKQCVSNRLENEVVAEKPLHLSSLVVACAYVWVCLMKARWCEGSDITEAMEFYLVTVDARARLDPPLPANYFGNCLGGVMAMAKRSDLIGEDGIAIAAKLIGTEIQNFNIYPQLKYDPSPSFTMSIPPELIEAVGSSPKFAVYDTDFGWGKPKKVEMSSIDSGQVMSLSECPGELGALEIGLVRNKLEMDAFAKLFAKSLKELS